MATWLRESPATSSRKMQASRFNGMSLWHPSQCLYICAPVPSSVFPWQGHNVQRGGMTPSATLRPTEDLYNWNTITYHFIIVAYFNSDAWGSANNWNCKLHWKLQVQVFKSPNYLPPSIWFSEPTKKVTRSGPADCGWGSIPMPLAFISVMNWLSSGTQSVEFGGGGERMVVGVGVALALGRPTGRLARQSFGNLLILSGPLWCDF